MKLMEDGRKVYFSVYLTPITKSEKHFESVVTSGVRLSHQGKDIGFDVPLTHNMQPSHNAYQPCFST